MECVCGQVVIFTVNLLAIMLCYYGYGANNSNTAKHYEM